jgi:hypothetical protein
MGFDLVNEEATVLLLITLSPTTLCKQRIEIIKMGRIICVLFLLVDVLKDNVLKVVHLQDALK